MDVIPDDKKLRLYLAFELLESDLWDYLNRVCKPTMPHMPLRPLPMPEIKVLGSLASVDVVSDVVAEHHEAASMRFGVLSLASNHPSRSQAAKHPH